MKSKAVENLAGWIKSATTLNNKYINSFLNGIKRDIIAVRNSIIYDYNNGVAGVV